MLVEQIKINRRLDFTVRTDTGFVDLQVDKKQTDDTYYKVYRVRSRSFRIPSSLQIMVRNVLVAL